METKQFIEVFSEIGTSSFGATKTGSDQIEPKYEALHVLSVLRNSLSALNEFGGENGSRAVYLNSKIMEKFDSKSTLGVEISNFMNSVMIMVIESNRFVWDAGKIAKTLEQIENEII